MKHYKYYAALGLITLSCVCLMTGCKKKHREKIDLSAVQTTEAAPETMAPETTASQTHEAEGNGSGPAGSAQSSTSVSKRQVTAQINTYTSGKVSIQYPSIQNLDTDNAADIDALLKKNALAILDAWQIDDSKVSMEIKCEVPAADRNRITAVYTGWVQTDGGAHPDNLFYTNTVLVSRCEDMQLEDFADPYTMAGYVLSDDCEFYNVSDALAAELMKAKNDMTIEQYTELFRNADFPLKKGQNSGTTTESLQFPGSFSYEHEGTIFFSIPVIHALGDYAVVAYTPDTK